MPKNRNKFDSDIRTAREWFIEHRYDICCDSLWSPIDNMIKAGQRQTAAEALDLVMKALDKWRPRDKNTQYYRQRFKDHYLEVARRL